MLQSFDVKALRTVANRAEEVAVNPGAWKSLIEEVTQAVGASCASLLHASHAAGEVEVAAVTDSCEAFFQRYVGDGWNRADVRTRAIPLLISRGVAVDQDIVAPDEMATHPYYQELLRPPA